MGSLKILTIAIPAYNMEKYLSRCIDSVLCIDLIEELEILIINDGSKDRTLEIASEYERKHPNIIRVVDKENGGWGSAINKAISFATGKYFRILDADDWYDSISLRQFIIQLKKLNCDLILTPYRYEYVNQGIQKEIPFKHVKYYKEYEYSDLLSLNWGKDWFDLPSITYCTEILQINNIRVAECFYSDIEYDYLPIKYVKSFIFLPINIYRYYIGREGQSVSPEGTTKYYKDHLYITKRAINYYLNMVASEDIVYAGFIKKIAIAKICQNYIALLKYYIDRTEANILLSEFDRYLYATSKELFKHSAKKLSIYNVIFPIKLWRCFGYNIYQSDLYRIATRLKHLI